MCQSKNKKVFPLISVFDVDILVLIPRMEGILVNISVSVYARMPILDMNIDETMYERGVKDL